MGSGGGKVGGIGPQGRGNRKKPKRVPPRVSSPPTPSRLRHRHQPDAPPVGVELQLPSVDHVKNRHGLPLGEEHPEEPVHLPHGSRGHHREVQSSRGPAPLEEWSASPPRRRWGLGEGRAVSGRPLSPTAAHSRRVSPWLPPPPPFRSGAGGEGDRAGMDAGPSKGLRPRGPVPNPCQGRFPASSPGSPPAPRLASSRPTSSYAPRGSAAVLRT